MKTKKRVMGLFVASFLVGGIQAQTKMHETVYNTSPQNIHYVTDHYGIAESHRVILSYFHQDWDDTSSPNHTIVTETNVDGVIQNAREIKNFRGKEIIQGLNHFNVLSEKESKLVGFNFNGFNTWSKQYYKNDNLVTFTAMATLSGYYNGSQILAAGAKDNELNVAVIDIIDGAVANGKSHKIGNTGRKYTVLSVYCGISEGYILSLVDQYRKTYLIKLDYNLDILWIKKLMAEEQSHTFEIHEMRSLGSEQIVLAGTSLDNSNGILKPTVMNLRADGSQMNYVRIYSTNPIDQMCESAEMGGGEMHLAIRNEDTYYQNAHTYEYIKVRGTDGIPLVGHKYSVSAANQQHTTKPQPTHIVLNQGAHMVGTVISNIHAVQTGTNGEGCDSENRFVLSIPIETYLLDIEHEEDPGEITASNREVEIEEKELNTTERCSQEFRSSLFEGTDPTIEVESPTANIYPNPSNGNFNIQIENASQAQISILDMTGKVVKTVNYTGGEISIEGLSKGLYNLRIQTPEKQFTERLVIQ